MEAKLVVVRVQDTGIGLSAETQPHIFELFTQAPAAEELVPGGMGIRPALVKKIIEVHGGALDVLSEGPGKGCEFSIHLRFEQRNDFPAAQAAN